MNIDLSALMSSDVWKQDLSGFIMLGNRKLDDNEIRILIKWATDYGYNTLNSIPEVRAWAVIGNIKNETKMKCKLHKCKGACCYNIPFENNELETYKDKIVTPYFDTLRIRNRIVPITDAVWNKNKCPFLTAEFKCNIYENRPEVCRLMGESQELPCEYRKN